MSDVDFQVFYKEKETEQSWKQLVRIVSGLASPKRKLCVSIAHAFVREQMDDIDVVIFMVQRGENRYSFRTQTECALRYIGFALIAIRLEEKHPEMYIQLMCAEKGHGYGRRLMNFIQQLATTHDNIEFVTLSSLAHTINFYRKLGFTHFEPKNGLMEEDHKLITPAAEKVSEYIFHNTIAVLEHPEMSQFIALLLEEKLTADKETKELWDSTQEGYVMAMKITK